MAFAGVAYRAQWQGRGDFTFGVVLSPDLPAARLTDHPLRAYEDAGLALGELPRGSRADYSGPTGNRRVCCMLIERTRGLPAEALVGSLTNRSRLTELTPLLQGRDVPLLTVPARVPPCPMKSSTNR